jgi:hypothetical protein
MEDTPWAHYWRYLLDLRVADQSCLVTETVPSTEQVVIFFDLRNQWLQ